MTKVIADISMSIDGFVTGGCSKTTRSTAPPSSGRWTTRVPSSWGAALFDIIDDPRGWSDDMGYGADLAGRPPFFVVTHFAPVQVRLGLDFTFCADIGAAIDQPRAAAGDQGGHRHGRRPRDRPVPRGRLGG